MGFSMRARRVSVAAALIATLSAIDSTAQTVNLLTSRGSAQAAADEPPPNRVQIAVPAGAMAVVGEDDASSGVGPILGFQRWERDKSFLGVFFSFAPESQVQGAASEFGAFLLNPPMSGTSFYLAGNRLFDVKRIALVGPSGRLGVAATEWAGQVGTSTTDTTVKGTTSFGSAGVLVMTPTNMADLNSNEYQLGVELALTYRAINGDLAQEANDAFRAAVIGTQETSFRGKEVTFFARLNSLQPFMRMSWLGDSVPGFSGRQTVFGLNVLSAIFQGELARFEIIDPGTIAAQVYKPLNRQLAVRGGRPSYTWTYRGTMPAGLDLSTDGMLHGTPTASIPAEIDVQATDSIGRRAARTIKIAVTQ